MSTENAEILLLTHGGWGEKLIESMKMILGDTPRVSEIALTANETFQEFYEKVENKVSQLADNSVIMTDLYGGTTSNVSAKLSQLYKIRVISGLNAPMLLEAISSIDSLESEETIERIVSSAQNGCKDVIKLLEKAMNKN
ncbi:PTS sugar transporter subunit IIA [Abyssisolibacter fermentans]|uniref:PTS sugar transporter subunit IIA n=1 Tax=Abyssisolibacter fermentans TaxID=1766203 RepID=UPI000834DEDB|nr:PTS sugar transporter subunit IIA [Abyssisolibacter fermentans]